MKTRYHREITLKALAEYFQADALETVITANQGQDALRYQVGHDHFHYDSNSFAAGDAYCEEQRHLVVTALQRGDWLLARAALGRLTHTVQDLYAHSNYVALWRASHPDLSPDDIDPQVTGILLDARLQSGKIYYPLEAFSFIPAFKPFVLPLLPRDSHAWMNLDDPSRPGFEEAFAAAVKRTSVEFLRLTQQLSTQEISWLTGNQI